jgi:hypothetical protein
MSTWPLAEPALIPEAEPPPEPLVAPEPAIPPADPRTDDAPPLDPAVVFEVVFVDWFAVVLWLVVAFGLIVTLLCGIALKLASVSTVVLAFGFTRCVALVLVLLRARLVVSPDFLDPPACVPVAPVPACVFDVVLLDWVADVVWLVVPLGLMVTLLCGIALKLASVFTVVLALGFTDWVELVLVSLPAWLVVFCATAALLKAAKTAAAITLMEVFRIMRISSW